MTPALTYTHKRPPDVAEVQMAHAIVNVFGLVFVTDQEVRTVANLLARTRDAAFEQGVLKGAELGVGR
jgi:hypothetical protein